MSNARTIPWETIADWYAKNEQAIRDVMKFEGLRGAVNEVLRLAPDQPELSALREELAQKVVLAVRDVCELDPADSDDPECICIKASDLGAILSRHFEGVE